MQYLADARAHLGSLLGAPSFADYALDSATLAGHPDAVTGFLSQLHTALQPQVSFANIFLIMPITLIMISTLPDEYSSSVMYMYASG